MPKSTPGRLNPLLPWMPKSNPGGPDTPLHFEARIHHSTSKSINPTQDAGHKLVSGINWDVSMGDTDKVRNPERRFPRGTGGQPGPEGVQLQGA